MTSKDNSNIYLSGEYARKNPQFHIEDSPWKAAQIVKMIEKQQLRFQSVCEVGCGAGGILASLHAQLPDTVSFYGFEISPQAYSLAQTQNTDRLKFFNEDLLGKSEHYDLLLCIDVFEHVDDYLGFLRTLRKHGHKFIFHIPLDISMQLVMRSHRLLYLREQVGHIHYFTADTALATLRDTGYQVIDSFFTAGILELGHHEGLGTKLLQWPRKWLRAVSPSTAAKLLGGFSLLVLAE